MKQSIEELYRLAMQEWGYPSQFLMVIEELGELQHALIKVLRNGIQPNKIRNNLAEEIADVEIMLGQLKEFYHLHEQVTNFKDIKINRLVDILREHKENRKNELEL